MDIVITATEEQESIFEASCLETPQAWLQHRWNNKCRQRKDDFVEKSGQGSMHSTEEEKSAIITGLNLQPRTE